MIIDQQWLSIRISRKIESFFLRIRQEGREMGRKAQFTVRIVTKKGVRKMSDGLSQNQQKNQTKR